MRALLLAVGFLLVFVVPPAIADTIIDYSALPVNEGNNTFANGGVQFLNASDFHLEGVRILMGSDVLAAMDFQVIQFDAGMGDTTGTVIGTLADLSGYNGRPLDSFADDSFFVDLSALELKLIAGVTYGFVFDGETPPTWGAKPIFGGSTDSQDTNPNIGSIFAGDSNGTFSSSQAYEIPFQAFGTAVPEPQTAVLIGGAFLALALRRPREP